MYRINLYREYYEKRLQAKRRSFLTALLAILAGVEAMLIVSLAIGGMLARDQSGHLRADVERLRQQVAAGSAAAPEAAVAARILAVRRQRCDWYPKLAGVSCAMDPSLILIVLNGQSSDKGREPRLDLTGLFRSAASDLDPLSRFTKSLSNDPAIAEDFPRVALETVEGGASSRFKVSCQAPRSEAP